MSHEKLLKEYNQWRRGDDGYEMPDPTAIGIAIDSVLAKLADLKEELELQETWRKLAIQFDGHRMQAMGLLKAVATGAATSEDCAEFVKLPPLSALEITEQAQSLKARVAELAVRVAELEGRDG